MRTFDRTLSRTAVLQIDSVNVLQRAHYMPLFSPDGPLRHRPAAPGRPSSGRAGIVEYWAHVAAFMPVELWPHMRHRMRRLRGPRPRVGGDPAQAGAGRLAAGRGRRARRRRRRATSTTGCPARRSTGAGTGPTPRRCMEYLFASGQLAVAGRNSASSGSTTCPSGCIPRRAPRRPRADRRGGLGRAAPPGGGRARRRHASSTCATTSGCAPSSPRPALADPGRVRRAAAGADRGLGPAGLPAPRRGPAAPGAGPRPALARSTRWCGSASAPSTSSTSTTASRSTSPRPSGCTATTCCRSCSATGSSAGSTSRPTARRGVLLVLGAFAEPGAPEETADELAAELRDLAGWLAWTTSWSHARRPGRRAGGRGEGRAGA